jgi:hypothetical protein
LVQQDVQKRELSLIRYHEARLLAQEEENATKELVQMSTVSSSLARLSSLLRQVIVLQHGEDPEAFVGEGREKEDWAISGATEHSLERDIELARLEKENEELRRLIGALPPQPRKDNNSDFRPMFEVPHPARLPGMQRGGMSFGNVRLYVPVGNDFTHFSLGSSRISGV